MADEQKNAKPSISAEEFAAEYARRSGVTVEWLKAQGREPRPCDCDYENCQGWQMVNVADWMLGREDEC